MVLRAEYLELLFLVYMFLISFSVLFQESNVWTWRSIDATYVYETSYYTIKVGSKGTAWKPLLLLYSEVEEIGILEISDLYSSVGNVALGDLNVSFAEEGNALSLKYRTANGSLIYVKPIFSVGDRVKIVFTPIRNNSARHVISIWSWYFKKVDGKELSFVLGSAELEVSDCLVLDVKTRRGHEFKVILYVKPRPERIVLYADSIGVNRLELYVSGNAEITIVLPKGSPVYARRLIIVLLSILLIAIYMFVKKFNFKVNLRRVKGWSIKGAIIIGVIIRLLVMPFTMHIWDITTIQEGCYCYVRGVDPYEYVRVRSEELKRITGLPLYYEGFNYLPLALYVFLPFYLCYTSMGFSYNPIIGGHEEGMVRLVYPDIYVFLFMVKVPLFLAELGVIYLLYRKRPSLAALYAIHPYPILISCVWGHFDGLVGLLILLSVLTFEKYPFISGVLYGASLMKIYTVTCFGAYLAHLRDKRRFLSFAAGALIALLPLIYELLFNWEDFGGAVLYHGSRQMGGVNMFNIIRVLNSTPYVLFISRIVFWVFIFAFIIANLIVYVFGKGISLARGVTVLMLIFILFYPVNNEQYLASILPIMVYSFRFPPLLPLVPLVYAFFNSPAYLYFMTPALYSTSYTKDCWVHAWRDWYEVFNPYIPYVFYTIGSIMSLLALNELVLYIRDVKSSIPS